MASKGIRVSVGLVIVLVAIVHWPGAMSQSGACTNVLISMASCLDYVTGTSSTPSSSCCSQLATVVRSQPQCLCVAIGGGASQLGVSINRAIALTLPGACKVQTPPVSKCDEVNEAGVISPAGSPQGLPTVGEPVKSGSSLVGPNKESTFLLQLVLVALFVVASGGAFG